MGDYMDYLSRAVASSGEIITYRFLSRLAKVHVNEAKQMLYRFYAPRAGNVHAIFVITGVRKVKIEAKSGAETRRGWMEEEEEEEEEEVEGEQEGGSGGGNNDGRGEENQDMVIGKRVRFAPEPEEMEDVEMDVTPPVEQSRMQICMEFVDADRVDGWLLGRGFIWSFPLKARSMERYLPKREWWDTSNPYMASLLNPLTRMQPLSEEEKMRRRDAMLPRREEWMQPMPTTESIAASEVKQEIGSDAYSGSPAEPEACQEEEEAIFTGPPRRSTWKKKRIPKPPNVQSDLLTTWGKASEKKKRPEPEPQPSPTAESVKSEDDPTVKMEIDSDEYEAGREPVPVKDLAEYAKKRKEKQDGLVKMMDEDEDLDGDPKGGDPEADKKGPKPPEETWEQETELPAGSVAGVTTSGGRRRGKRKIMKRVQVKDADGYLVTEMKPSWESFSEDEPEPTPKLKPKPRPKATLKGGKKGAVTGQGDIGSYFSRKPPTN